MQVGIVNKVGSKATLFRSAVNAAVPATPAHLQGGQTEQTDMRTRSGGREEEEEEEADSPPAPSKLTAAAAETSERLH